MTSFFSSFAKSTDLKKGCSQTSPAAHPGTPSRLEGSFSRSYNNKFSETEHAFWIFYSHQLKYVLGLSAEEPGEVWLLVADGPEELVLVASVEGRLPYQHLVQQDSERPPVHTVGVLQAFDDLNINRVE